jgi:hypothetical protein
MIKLIRNHKAQEEMVGFIVIVVIVSVILLILLGFMLNKSGKETVESYEVESFIQSALQYTSSCETYGEFLSVQNLIVSCESGNSCLDGKASCDVLNDTLNNLIRESWNVNNQSAVRGYKLGIMEGSKGIFLIQYGNETKNYQGGFQDFTKGGGSYEVSFSVYS